MSDKPLSIRALPLLTRDHIAEIRTDYQCRRESLLAVDEGVGAIIGALRARGELSNTLFIFTSDNGFFQGEHRLPYGKVKVYEPSARVPTLMRGPGVPAGRRVSALASNVDLAATIVEATGARPARTLDGVSLRALAQTPSLFSGRKLLLETGPEREPSYATVRTSRYKYVEHETGERELYDLFSDPYEERSVHDDPGHADARRRLERELARLRACAGAECTR